MTGHFDLIVAVQLEISEQTDRLVITEKERHI